MGKVLGIVYRSIATHLAHKAGFAKPMAQTGAVTLKALMWDRWRKGDSLETANSRLNFYSDLKRFQKI